MRRTLVVFLWLLATAGVTYVANTAVELVDLQVFPGGERIEVLSLPETTVPVVTTTVPVVTTTTTTSLVPQLVGLAPDAVEWRVGAPARERLFSGGVEPYVATVAAGSLPAGVTLNDRGEVVGTPSVSGLFDATVRLTDAVGQTLEETLTIIISQYQLVSAKGGSVTVVVTGDSVGFFSALQAAGFMPAEVVRSGPLVVEVVFLPVAGDDLSWVRCEVDDGVVCASR